MGQQHKNKTISNNDNDDNDYNDDNDGGSEVSDSFRARSLCCTARCARAIATGCAAMLDTT